LKLSIKGFKNGFVNVLKKMFGSKKKIIIWVIVLAVVGGGSFFAYNAAHGKKAAFATTKDVKASTRTIENVITGTSTIEPKDSYNVTALVTGEVLTAPFNEGDQVNKGDVLYTIDSSDVQKSIDSSKLSLQKAQDSYQDALKSQEDLTLYSNVTGKVKTTYVEVGDSVQSGAKIADVYDDSTMKLKVPFNVNDVSSIHSGDTVKVTLTSGGGELTGKVHEIASASQVLNGYALVKMVTVYVTNPGTLAPDDKATASIGSIACNDAGSFSYLTETTITSKSSGDIVTLNLTEGNSVYNNQKIMVLDSDSITNNVKSAKLSLEDAQIGLQKSQEQLDDYTIKAPISGKVITKNTKAGDNLDNKSSASTSSSTTSSSSSSAMAVIYDMSELTFDMSVDELEVNQIKVGQAVTITADAISDKTYNGVVQKVSISGTTASGVTTYPVTVKVTDVDDQLLPGMNVSASIVTSQVENAVAVPVNAVQRGNIIYVKGTKAKSSDKAPEGYKTVEVKIGISDDNFVEIKSGIKAGDTVRVEIPVVKASTGETKTMMGGGEGQGEGEGQRSSQRSGQRSGQSGPPSGGGGF